MTEFWIAVVGGATGTLLTAVLAFGARLTRSDRRSNPTTARFVCWINTSRRGSRTRFSSSSPASASRRVQQEEPSRQRRVRSTDRLGEGGRATAVPRPRADSTGASRGHPRSRGSPSRLAAGLEVPVPDLDLRAPERVLPVLTEWALPPKKHLAPTDPLPDTLESDPRDRTVERALSPLQARPGALG